MHGGTSVASWDEVKPLAERIFQVWSDRGDLRWGERAWQHLARFGLANYSTSLERVIVDIRLMTLGSIYLDWCAVAHEERHDDTPTYWLGETEISFVHLGQLVGPDSDLGDEDQVENAVHALIGRERPLVLRSLLDGFGDVSGLFVSLWRSAMADESNRTLDDDEDQEPTPTDRDVLNDVTEENLAAYQWIDDGCEQLGPERCRTDFD